MYGTYINIKVIIAMPNHIFREKEASCITNFVIIIIIIIIIIMIII